MKKRILSWLLTLALLCTLLPAAALIAHAETYSGTCGAEGDNLTWSFDTETGVLAIEGSGDMEDYYYDDGKLATNCPWYSYHSSIQELRLTDGLTRIGEWAFYDCSSLTSVTIPDSVTRIGELAFWSCRGLTSVTIPDSVTVIGNQAFSDCSSLTSVTIPDGVTKLSVGLFSECSSLTSVTIPNSVTSIGWNAFAECFSLTSIAIPDSVTNIGSSAFYGCNSLTSVTIPDGVTRIDNSVFNNCHRLTSITIPKNVTSIGRDAFFECTSLKNVTIPDSVTIIGDAAFYGCSSLTCVALPDGVDSIGRRAFYDCRKLTRVSIPKSVTSIGEQAFGWDKDDIKIDGFTICGYKNTAAETYAIENGFQFIPQFDDILSDAYYADPVAWAVEQNITNGTGPTTFSPNDVCTRGQVVTFLWRAKGSPEPTKSDNPFEDVTGGFYYKAVLWAVENEITAGMDATHFGPGEPCTRGQVVTFLWRTEGKPEPTSENNPFTDVTGGFYYKAVLWAVENKITAGMDATHFAPANTCTRGQIVTFLYRDLAE